MAMRWISGLKEGLGRWGFWHSNWTDGHRKKVLKTTLNTTTAVIPDKAQMEFDRRRDGGSEREITQGIILHPIGKLQAVG